MNRGKPGSLLRVLIYLFPAVMDMIVAQILFVATLRLAKMGVSAVMTGGAAIVWSVVYMVACPLIGPWVKPSNAARLMLAACAILILASALFILLPGIIATYVLCGVSSMAAVLFFTPFQIFMRAVDRHGKKTITYSTGLYTFAWSAGYAVGPFVSGYLMEMGSSAAPGQETSGWKYAFAMSGAAAALTAAGIYGLKNLVYPANDNLANVPAPEPELPAFDYSRMPDLVWLGWMSGGAGVLVLFIVRSVFPSHAVSDMNLAESTQGALFFVLSITQALTGLALCFGRLWMYRPLPVLLSGLAGIAGMLLLGFCIATPFLYAGAVLVGIYAGAFFFYLVFHALTHPARSAQYVSINESVVGAGGILGPALGGLLMDHWSFGRACLAGSALILLVSFFQAAVHRLRPPRPEEAPQ